MGVQLQVRLSPLQAAWVRALVQVLLKAGGSPGLSVQLPAPGNTFFCAIGFLYTQNVWGILVLNPASAISQKVWILIMQLYIGAEKVPVAVAEGGGTRHHTAHAIVVSMVSATGVS